jgi:hypothetical protein
MQETQKILHIFTNNFHKYNIYYTNMHIVYITYTYKIYVHICRERLEIMQLFKI